jgi:hypothetical protein
MAAVEGVPSLSSLLAWPTDHLTQAVGRARIGPREYASDQCGGNYTCVGKDATVILSKDGK